MMKPPTIILLTAIAALVAAAPAISRGDGQNNASTDLPSGGSLATMQHGTYQCALPGDAGSAAFRVIDEESFRIFTASRYETMDGAGTYILRGDNLTFTRGPKNGQQFRRVGRNQLRKVESNGETGDLLCTRIGAR